MMWFKNMKIRTKLLISFGAVIVIVMALSALAITELRNIDNTYSNLLKHPVEGEVTLLQLRGEFRTMRRIINGIAAWTGTETNAYLDNLYNTAVTSYNNCEKLLQDYENNIETNDQYNDDDKTMRLGMSENCRSVIQRYKSEILDPIIVVARTGDRIQTLEYLGQASIIADELAELIDIMLGAAENAAETQSKDATDSANVAVNILIGIALAAIFLSFILALFIASIIQKPIQRLVDVSSNVLKGNLHINMDRKNVAKDEIGALTLDMYELVDVIKTMIAELSAAHHEINEVGDFEYRLDAKKYSGSYKEMAESINASFDGFTDDIMELLRGVTEMGDGKNVSLKKMPGKKIVINEKFDVLGNTLEAISGSINTLAKSAAEGKLDVRIDTARFKGGWAEISEGLNALVTAVATPLSEIESTLNAMSNGIFHKMTGNYKGAFDSVERAVNATEENTLSYVNEISETLGAMSEGDLTISIDRDYNGIYAPIKQALNKISESLNSTMSEIKSSSEQVLSGASQISISAQHLADGASKQASSIEELNASIEMINDKIQSNSERADSANELSQKANQHAQAGTGEMKAMVSSMEGINDSSTDISKIIKVIED
ncbi:MAG: MCP four helix bundle domain-containing protein, partial [Clostridiales bacterium]|nr:MCP four helix bundle domain-containing protein [Clostridiales bacterium]